MFLHYHCKMKYHSAVNDIDLFSYLFVLNRRGMQTFFFLHFTDLTRNLSDIQTCCSYHIIAKWSWALRKSYIIFHLNFDKNACWTLSKMLKKVRWSENTNLSDFLVSTQGTTFGRNPTLLYSECCSSLQWSLVEVALC